MRVGAWLLALVVVGCAAGPRPPVVARDAGRIDGKRSISSMSDTSWRIEREPDPAPDELVEEPEP